jgi:hypothetical protein
MRPVELVGYLACALAFATFYMTAMIPLRLIAIASNVAFITYGYLGGMTPILLLHVGLLPLNMWRLNQTLRSRKGPERAAEPPSMVTLGTCGASLGSGLGPAVTDCYGAANN